MISPNSDALALRDRGVPRLYGLPSRILADAASLRLPMR